MSHDLDLSIAASPTVCAAGWNCEKAQTELKSEFVSGAVVLTAGLGLALWVFFEKRDVRGMAFAIVLAAAAGALLNGIPAYKHLLRLKASTSQHDAAANTD